MRMTPAPTAPTGTTRSALLFIASSVLFVAAVLGVLVHFDAHRELVRLLVWVDAQGMWAPGLFMLLMALVVVLLLPGIFFTTGAGFIFGVVEGSTYVVLGTTLGAAVAFLIARHLFGRRAARFITARSRLRAVDTEMTRNDWKVVMMTRLIPFFPSKIANYFFGLTSFTFRGYVLGSLLGFIPFSVHNVYLGAVAASLATLGERETTRSATEWTLYGAGLAATIIAVAYLSRLARRALASYTRENDPDEASL